MIHHLVTQSMHLSTRSLSQCGNICTYRAISIMIRTFAGEAGVGSLLISPLHKTMCVIYRIWITSPISRPGVKMCRSSAARLFQKPSSSVVFRLYSLFIAIAIDLGDLYPLLWPQHITVSGIGTLSRSSERPTVPTHYHALFKTLL